MVGLFIKDMWMPSHCGKCPLAMLNSYGERRCFVTDSNVTDSAAWAEYRPGDCPMFEMVLEE